MNLLKRFLNHPTMILTNDLFVFGFVIVCALWLGLMFVSAFVGAPCPECGVILQRPFDVIFGWLQI